MTDNKGKENATIIGIWDETSCVMFGFGTFPSLRFVLEYIKFFHIRSLRRYKIFVKWVKGLDRKRVRL